MNYVENPNLSTYIEFLYMLKRKFIEIYKMHDHPNRIEFVSTIKHSNIKIPRKFTFENEWDQFL